MSTYTSTWLKIDAFNSHNSKQESNTYLFRTSDEQKASFLKFLNAIDQYNGYWPFGLEKESVVESDKQHYASIFEDVDAVEYLELISDYFPNVEGGFDILTIDFENIKYGYKNN